MRDSWADDRSPSPAHLKQHIADLHDLADRYAPAAAEPRHG
ncbi:hypothetical protein ACU686_35615 [Yinghuangia aomiensis]